MINISLTSGWDGDGSMMNSFSPMVIDTYPAITTWNQLDQNNPPTPASFFATVDDATLAQLQADPNYNNSLVIL